MGNVCTAGEGQAPTRQATLGAGIRTIMICILDLSQLFMPLDMLVAAGFAPWRGRPH